jgi:hypothetical protein
MLYDWAYGLINVGRTMEREGIGLSCEDVLPRDSRITLARKINARAEAATAGLLHVAGRIGVVALAMDAGSIKGRSFLTMMLVNALTGESPTVLRVELRYGGSGRDYERSCDWAVEAALDPAGANCDICGIVCDNLSAQNAGIRKCVAGNPLAAGLQNARCGASCSGWVTHIGAAMSGGASLMASMASLPARGGAPSRTLWD